MRFFKIYFKNYNVQPRVIYTNATLDNRDTIKSKDLPVTIEDDITFRWSDIDIVEQIPDDVETIEKTLAYAKTLWSETYSKAKQRTKQNQAPRPIRAVRKRHDNNALTLNNNSNGSETPALWENNQ